MVIKKNYQILYNFNIWLQPDQNARGVCKVKVFEKIEFELLTPSPGGGGILGSFVGVCRQNIC